MPVQEERTYWQCENKNCLVMSDVYWGDICQECGFGEMIRKTRWIKSEPLHYDPIPWRFRRLVKKIINKFR
jgi:hypothetical protein